MTRNRKRDGKVVFINARPGVKARLEGKLAPRYDFRLYIAGTNLNSVRAIENVRGLIKHLRPSECELEIIDLYQQPALAKRDEVVAAPVLIKTFPLPRRSFVGDLSNTEKVFAGLGITTAIKDVRIKSAGQ